MRKYVKSFLLVILQNTFCLTFVDMINDYKHWGTVLILVVGFIWLILLSMIVVAISHTKLPTDKSTN